MMAQKTEGLAEPSTRGAQHLQQEVTNILSPSLLSLPRERLQPSRNAITLLLLLFIAFV